ncbi:MAG: DUF937 domain-containing protein [Mariniphaga sp.]|nr:DUF937 domain-containing protein [Mariniphaga sp.]MDD4426745.1 DUF937 domain-containing protein [Mariniphaga sp.]
MENLLNSILSRIDDNSLQAIGQQANASPTQAKSALASAIPILMNALAKNSSTPDGAQSLQNALARDHDGSLLDNLGSLLQNPDSANGAGILKHVLGNKRQNVEKYISQDSGLSGGSAGKILEMAAPILMGYLGKKNATGSNNVIGNLLNSYVKAEKKQAPQAQSIINQLLDRDNDGSIMDDIAEMGMSFLGKMKKR